MINHCFSLVLLFQLADELWQNVLFWSCQFKDISTVVLFSSQDVYGEKHSEISSLIIVLMVTMTMSMVTTKMVTDQTQPIIYSWNLFVVSDERYKREACMHKYIVFQCLTKSCNPYWYTHTLHIALKFCFFLIIWHSKESSYQFSPEMHQTKLSL